MRTSQKASLDHIIVAVPHLKEALENFKRQSGYLPMAGGRHENYKTHNALISFDQNSYLEFLAPDPESTQEGKGLLEGQSSAMVWAWFQTVAKST